MSALGIATSHYVDPPVLSNFTNATTLGGATAVYDRDLSPSDRIHVSVDRRQTRFEAPNENLQGAASQRPDRHTVEDRGQAAWTHLVSRDLLFGRAHFGGIRVGEITSILKALPARPRSRSHRNQRATMKW